MYRLDQDHTAGVEFIRLANLGSLDSDEYFRCLRALTYLFKDIKFNDTTPAFYLNYITNINDDNKNSLRITYYTIKPIETLKILKEFVNVNREIAIFDSSWTSRPDDFVILKMQGKEEIEFINFLNRNTRIILDIIENFDTKQFQLLIYKYRYTDLPNRLLPRKIFEPIFLLHSPYYRSLKKESLDNEYWSGLTRLFNGGEYGLHFLINIMTVEESTYDPRYFDNSWFSETQ